MVEKSPLASRYFNSFTGRLLLGALLIHLVLLPLLFGGMLFSMKQEQETQFVQQVRSYAYLLAEHLAHEPNRDNIQQMLEDALFNGQIELARILTAQGQVEISLGEARMENAFVEDFSFGENGDALYHISAPMLNAKGELSGHLQLAYNETPVSEQTAASFRRGIVLAVTYFLISIALIVFLSPRLTSMQRRLAHQSQHDSLTGLPNRLYMQDRLGKEVVTALKGNHSFAVLLMDLNRFKEINDTLGHDVGDNVLTEVAARLSTAIPDNGVVARLGGDEFIVLLPECDAIEAETMTKEVLKKLQQPFKLGEQSLHIGPGVGVVLFPDHGTDANTLLRRADVAMYEAKRQRSHYMFYESGIDKHSLRKLRLSNELRQALRNTNEIQVYFQPKIDLNDDQVGSAEVLVRWQHPKLGLVLPDEFVPLAEQVGLIDLLTEHVFRLTLQQCQAWREAGMRRLNLAINLSAWNLQDDQLPDKITALLGQYQTDPSCIELELTESAIFSNPDQATEILGRIHAAGIRIAIDDFGTGYSSLTHLKKLPFTQLKIDRSFVRDMESSDNDAAIVHASVELASSLGLISIAEGVEHESTLRLLKKMGCDMAQGYFFSRPLPADQFENWLREHNKIFPKPVELALSKDLVSTSKG